MGYLCAPHQILLPRARLQHKAFTQYFTVTSTYPCKSHTVCTKHVQLSFALSKLAFTFPYHLEYVWWGLLPSFHRILGCLLEF
jgi:hypothetical protein